MDLSQLSDQDLMALQSGDLTKLSDQGLTMISSGKQPKEKNILESVTDYAKNNTMGALRGAAGIGTTLLRPLDATGITGTTNADRKASIDQFFNENADTGSFGFGAGKLGAEVAGTAGVGGAIAKPIAGIAPKIAAALQSGGMVANGAGMPTRIAAGAVTGGASAGLIDPESAGAGAAIGGALPPAVKIAGALGRGVGSMVEPFYQGGRERILGRALNAAAGNQADDALRNLQNAKPIVPNSQPTAGMVAQSPGIAALERASVANNPVATNELAIRQAANNEARLAALQDITPDRVAAQQAREAATTGLYNQSSQAPVAITPELGNLLQRPSMQGAVARAAKLAEEANEVFDLNNLNGRSAQYLKMALDDMANSAPMSGLGGNELRAIQGTRQAYLDELGKQVPEYLQANQQYAQLSKPIAQADLLEEIGKKATSFRGDLTPAAYARALQDKTAQSVTGRANATLDSVLDPQQLDMMNNIKQDLLNQDFAQTAGRGVGSNTVQNLAYTNMLDQFGIPTAMREFAPMGAVGNVLGQVGKVGYRSANERLASELAEVLLNPQSAANVMSKANKGVINPKLTELIANSLRTAPVLSAQ
jgi:hypothetical protein